MALNNFDYTYMYHKRKPWTRTPPLTGYLKWKPVRHNMARSGARIGNWLHVTNRISLFKARCDWRYPYLSNGYKYHKWNSVEELEDE